MVRVIAPYLLARAASLSRTLVVREGCEGQGCSTARLFKRLGLQHCAVWPKAYYQLTFCNTLRAVQASAFAWNVHQLGKALLILTHDALSQKLSSFTSTPNKLPVDAESMYQR